MDNEHNSSYDKSTLLTTAGACAENAVAFV
jgi:hypothetical protein